MYPVTTNDLFDTVFSDFNSLMNSSRFSFNEVFPPMNIFYDEAEKTCTIQAATAGYSKEELSVNVNGRELTIEGKPVDEQPTEKSVYLRNKIHKCTFKRVYTLPVGYDFEQTKVTYKDGLLTIVIPMTEKKTSSRMIEIE